MKLNSVVRLEKRDCSRHYNPNICDCGAVSYNQVIDELRLWEFDFEALAKLMYQLRIKINGGLGFPPWKNLDSSHPMKLICAEDAENILQSMPTILVRKDNLSSGQKGK